MVLLIAFSKWLAATPLSRMILEAGWIIPTLQVIHILCVAVVFSSAVLVNFRIFGVFEGGEPLREVTRRFLPWIWPVLVILLVTGSLLIVGEPRRSLVNPTFYIKMALLLAAIVITAGLQISLTAAPASGGTDPWQRNPALRMAGRALATLSILVWCGILFAGRWIAYTQTG
jgi:Family of unknown function (DUF6644)